MFDPDRHTRRERTHYDASGQSIQLNRGVILEPFTVPDWVRSQADYSSALTAYVLAQIERGVTRTRIVEHLAHHVGGEHSDAEGFYRAVARMRRQSYRRRGWEAIMGGIFSLAVGCGVFALIMLLPDGSMPLWMPGWVAIAVQIAMVGIIVGGIVGGLTAIVAGAWRVIRYTV